MPYSIIWISLSLWKNKSPNFMARFSPVGTGAGFSVLCLPLSRSVLSESYPTLTPLIFLYPPDMTGWPVRWAGQRAGVFMGLYPSAWPQPVLFKLLPCHRLNMACGGKYSCDRWWELLGGVNNLLMTFLIGRCQQNRHEGKSLGLEFPQTVRGPLYDVVRSSFRTTGKFSPKFAHSLRPFRMQHVPKWHSAIILSYLDPFQNFLSSHKLPPALQALEGQFY